MSFPHWQEYSDNEDNQDPNLSQPQPSPDQTKQMAVSAKSGQSKVNSLTGKKKDDAGQQKGKGGNAGTSKSDNNEYYAKLEERLQQLSQRCTSMEETIHYQNRQNKRYIWIFSSVCIIAVIAYAVQSFFFNKEGTASPVSDSRLKAIEEQLRLIKGDVRSTRTYAEDILAATNEKLEKREKQIIQLNETLESLDHELNITTGKLNRTKEIQDIIHKNTFDKGSLIIVVLIIIIGLAALGFYVCVYKPWQPRNFSQANVSEAQQALSAVPNRPVLGSTVCIISFKLNRSAEYQALVRSALSTSGFADIMHEITKHTDIPRLPHCKMYIMCVEFSERHVIIEEPGIGLGDMKRTTYEAVSKLGGVLVILYVNHRGSRRIQDLYSTEIYCINRQPQLKTLETHNRFISTYDQLNDRQKDALKQALREALN